MTTRLGAKMRSCPLFLLIHSKHSSRRAGHWIKRSRSLLCNAIYIQPVRYALWSLPQQILQGFKGGKIAPIPKTKISARPHVCPEGICSTTTLLDRCPLRGRHLGEAFSHRRHQWRSGDSPQNGKNKLNRQMREFSINICSRAAVISGARRDGMITHRRLILAG